MTSGMLNIGAERAGSVAQMDDDVQNENAVFAPLQRIHPDETYEADPEARASLAYWRMQPTEDIIESLRPGAGDALMTKPDGRIMNGNTRTKVLQERGYDISALPREELPLDPLTRDD